MSSTMDHVIGDVNIRLFLGDGSPFGQLEKFHVCWRGMSFHIQEKVEEFSIYDFRILLQQEKQQAHDFRCNGVVVQCEPLEACDGGGYSAVIQFLDLPEAECQLLRELTHKCGLRCELCWNA